MRALGMSASLLRSQWRRRARTRARHLLGLAFCVSTFVAVPAQAAPPSDEGLVELRVEVETLADDLRAEREASRAELAALRAEKQDLEARVRLARARRDALRAAREDAQRRQEAKAGAVEAWQGPVQAAMQVVRAWVERSLPYARAQRIERVQALEAQLLEGRSDLAAVAEALWAFVQQELQLAHEVASTRQLFVTAEGERIFGEVLHFGLAAAYAHAPDERLFHARHTAEGWRFVELEGEARRVADELFDAHARHEIFGEKWLLIEAPGPKEAAP